MKDFCRQNISNIITLLRLIFAIVFLFHINNIFTENPPNTYIILAVIVFIIICLSDILDGKIARKLEIYSDFGAKFDVYTDLFFVISSVGLLCIKGLIPLWVLLLIIEKIINYDITSTRIKKREGNKFAYVKDPIGRVVSASYFAIPMVAFVLYTFFAPYYHLIYCLLIPQAILGIISSIARYKY